MKKQIEDKVFEELQEMIGFSSEELKEFINGDIEITIGEKGK